MGPWDPPRRTRLHAIAAALGAVWLGLLAHVPEPPRGRAGQDDRAPRRDLRSGGMILLGLLALSAAVWLSR